MELLCERGALVEYSDPYVPEFPKMREHKLEMKSVLVTAETRSRYDAVMIATDHDAFDYGLIAAHAALIVDPRERYLEPAANIVKG